MSFWYVFFVIIGIISIIILIFGLPRKKSTRYHNIESVDNPDVVKAFEKMTNFLPFKLLHRKVISRLKKFNPSGKLVDIGCGSGNLITQIAEKLSKLNLVGVDISSEILEHAKKRVIEKKVDKKVEFKNGTVENLPFPNDSVDFIISSLSLHHWVNPIKAFKEIHRILKENGTFLIFDFRRDSRKFFYGFLTFATKVVVPKALKNINEPLGSIQSSYTPDEVLQLISQFSFQNTEIKPYLAWMFISGKK